MLKQMRNGAQSIIIKTILFGLLMMAMAGLAFMDVQGVLKGGLGTTTVVEYEGGKIKVAEFTRLVQDAMRQQRISEKEAIEQEIPLQVLQSELSDRLFKLAAYDIGLKVGEDVVINQVHQIISPLVEQGATQEEALERVLANSGMSEKQFIQTIKNYMSSQQLLATIASGVKAPKALTEAMLKHKHELRDGKYFVLSTDDVKKIAPPKDEELQDYYTPIMAEYATPEYRNLSVVILDNTVVEKEIQISAEQIKQTYDENVSSFVTPETRKISQAVFKDAAIAKTVATRVKKDKQLEKATKEAEEVFIKSTNFTQEDMPEEFTEAAFAAKAGDIIGPIQSPLGWHILHIEKIMAEKTATLKEATPEIKKDLKTTLIEEAIYKMATKIDDDVAGGSSLEEISKAHALGTIKLINVDSDGANAKGIKLGKALPIRDQILKAGFNLEENAVSQMLETEDNKFIVVSADKITLAKVQPLAAVKTKVLDRWIMGKKTAALSDKIMDILADIETNNSFDKQAKKLGKTVTITKATKRDDRKADKTINNALFSLTKHHNVTSISSDKTVTILQLGKIKYEKASKPNDDEQKATERKLTETLKQDIVQQFLTYLMDKYDATINEDLIAQLYPANGEEEEL